MTSPLIEGFGITQNKQAVAIGVPPRRINEIVHGKRGITADTAICLARYFGTSEEFWMKLKVPELCVTSWTPTSSVS